ncbi:TPA: hypothetical protein EYP38_02050 [Candidatus Micrarchaeota archaeon]|nr:hypothetical protein [Candidatus Micrarchaeota archaeon]
MRPYSIRDNSVHNPDNRSIEIRYILATDDKGMAAWYSSKYIGPGGTPNAGFREIEGKIFQRVLQDNGRESFEMPDFMLQPVLLGFEDLLRDRSHKDFEGICTNPTPNASTLELVASLCRLMPEQFRKEYPILSSCFGE